VLLLSVGANTASSEVTASLLDFLLNDTEAAKITKLSMGAPSSSEVSEAILPELNDLESTFVEYMLTEMSEPRRRVPLKPEGSAELNGALSRASEEVAYGRTNIGDAAATVIAQSSQYLG
jgi:multiple sugar transport system substrate-binding protein